MRARLLLVMLVAAGCGREEAPVVSEGSEGPVSWSASVSVDKSEVQVGEDLTLTLTLTHPVGGDFVPPPASAFEPFQVLGTTEEAVSPVETRLHHRLAAFQLPEELEIPALEIGYRDEAGETSVLTTEPIPVRVVTSLTPEVTDIHDIKDPMELEVPRDLSLLWWVLAALLASLVAYLIYRKLRKEPEAVAATVPAPPLPPPDAEAEAALARLRERLERGEIGAFYPELAEVLKRYAGRRFEVPYLERTTSEMMADLRLRRLAPPVTSDLRAILEASDLVKFAKLVPERSEAETSLARALDLVERTRPVPVELLEPVEEAS